MSTLHIAWAFKQRNLTPTQKFVLVALAERCNKDTLRCDPSIRKLMEDTSLSRMGVLRSLDSLEKAGLIRKVHRQRENGSDTSNEYKFPRLTVTRGESPGDTPGGLSEVPPEPEVEPEVEPSLAPTAQERPRNEIWDALTTMFGEPTTPSTRTKRGKVARELKEAGATNAEILARGKRWPLHFDTATLTETALVNHWDRLGRKPLRAGGR